MKINYFPLLFLFFDCGIGRSRIPVCTTRIPPLGTDIEKELS
ncbi:hypothetical protein IMCC9480_2311 [Oxalobacteraceae bacterium IMCC9480]|nr:hypothetical protein IMCC9480_2311 [Oxalobacteraceae bacterium IMCC9480]